MRRAGDDCAERLFASIREMNPVWRRNHEALTDQPVRVICASSLRVPMALLVHAPIASRFLYVSTTHAKELTRKGADDHNQEKRELIGLDCI